MSYNGYLFSIGGKKVTGKGIIDEEEYQGIWHYLDQDSLRNANGTLIRTTLPKASMEVTFKTIDGLTNTQLSSLMKIIKDGYVTGDQRKLEMTAYISEFDEYKKDYVYLAEPTFTIKKVDNEKKIVYYKPIEFTFIGYGEA